jgi:antirestriction protein ArdC
MEHDKLSQALNFRLHRPATKCAIYKPIQIEYNYTMKTKQKLQDFVDSVVIPAMEKNKSNWDCIFKRGCFPQNAITQKEYKGINWFMLSCMHNKKEYSKPLFATYKQWATVKAQVNKGQKGTMIVFYKPLFKTSKVDPAKEVQSGCVLSYSTVFNIDQVDLTNSSFKEVQTEFKTGTIFN